MKARPGPAFDPDRYTRGYSREQIVDHLRETLEIVEELDPPSDLIHDVFAVAQVMVAAIEPVAGAVAQPSGPEKLRILGRG